MSVEVPEASMVDVKVVPEVKKDVDVTVVIAM